MANNAEKALVATGIAPQLYRNLTERCREPATPQVAEVAHQDTTDVVMDDEEVTHDAVLTDHSYDWHVSRESDSEEYDSSNNEILRPDRPIVNNIKLGEAIWFAFDVDMEYDVNDERHMFEEDLSDDESSDSNLSSNYEELMDVGTATCVVLVRNDEEEDDTPKSDDDLMKGDSKYETEQAWEDGLMPLADHKSSVAGEDTPATELGSSEAKGSASVESKGASRNAPRARTSNSRSRVTT